ncbi:MAG TPA: flagellar biosynthesis protein FlhF [Steroidobacteraceae bacterium]|jgi:flagellar biosynthesis protein FlhF|nr:flagellar biosynthesis protein FlhF [Steroidobacteraceae bacterium]
MKITRHTGPDIRHALRAVRDSLGANAVILATRRTANGVEITAAMDFDADNVQDSTVSAIPASVTAAAFVPLAPLAPVIPAAPIAPTLPSLQTRQPALKLPPIMVPAPTLAVRPEPVQFAPATPGTRPAVEPAAAPPPVEEPVVSSISSAVAAAWSAPAATETPAGTYVVPTLDAANDVMTSELKTLRRMLETQLAQLAWKDLTRRAPLHTEMLRELTEIGIEQGLAGEIVAGLPKLCEANVARRYLGATLSQRVPVTGDQWLEHGGRIALVGPTGVGKTTVLAKLAVRWVLRHGSRDLALVAGDSVRIGAQDQVRALGQLLGVPVFAMDSLDELPGVLARLGRFRMVLVDTPGAGQRDANLAQRLLQLSRVGGELQSTLVLAASTQAGAIEEVVRHFAPARPTSCVLTKVDEAVTLGGMLSVLIRARLPIAYVSDGQRVPEDLRPARAEELIATAVQLAQTNGAAADEDLLKRRFGDVAHALA